MNAFPASASGTTPLAAPGDAPRNVLVCGVNWLGDAVMTMPALAAFKRGHPGAHVTLVVKPWLAPLWRMHPAVNAVVNLEMGLSGLRAVRRNLAGLKFEEAYVLPNSFRSALVARLADARERIGSPGHQRGWMLTRTVRFDDGPGREHQCCEYFDIMGIRETSADLEPPFLKPAADLRRERLAQLAAQTGASVDMLSRPAVGIIPGSARGPAKRWPAECFIEVGRRLVKERGCIVGVCGSGSEQAVCGEVAAGIGAGAANLAGTLTLPQLAGLLAECRAVVTNDNGGMHLAAAVGAKIVAVFGITDAGKTGPLGVGHRIVTADGVTGKRDIPRRSLEAEAILRSIRPERVVREAIEVLDRRVQ